MKKLTIGSAVYDDYEGVFFTYQSLRLNNMDIWDDLDLIIIDNNPESAEGEATRDFCNRTTNIRYFPHTEKLSNSVKNEIFKHAEGEFCMSIDCHVLFEPDTISRLISFLRKNKNSDDLYHGPMFYDQIQGYDPCSKMDPIWRGDMWGIWATDERGNDKHNEPFEIEMHGCGVFLSRTESWLGFNEGFRGFGGEEGYIHTKYRQAGRKVWCLPFLRWVHRFNRPRGVPYPLKVEDRIRNYLIGHQELGLPFDEIIDHFKESQPHVNVQSLIDNLDEPFDQPPVSKPSEQDKVRQDHGNIQLWENSDVDFIAPTELRYVKYVILRSYDGYASLQDVKFHPNAPASPTIHSVSSEDENFPASCLLEDSGSWISNDADTGDMPHEVIIDLGEALLVEKISTRPRPGLNRGIPVEFKIFASLNLINWQEVSHVDILNS